MRSTSPAVTRALAHVRDAIEATDRDEFEGHIRQLTRVVTDLAQRISEHDITSDLLIQVAAHIDRWDETGGPAEAMPIIDALVSIGEAS